MGGGSMTLVPLVPGRCATGISKKVDMSKYQTLSEEQKVKIKVSPLHGVWGVVLAQHLVNQQYVTYYM